MVDKSRPRVYQDTHTTIKESVENADENADVEDMSDADVYERYVELSQQFAAERLRLTEMCETLQARVQQLESELQQQRQRSSGPDVNQQQTHKSESQSAVPDNTGAVATEDTDWFENYMEEDSGNGLDPTVTAAPHSSSTTQREQGSGVSVTANDKEDMDDFEFLCKRSRELKRKDIS
jgi:hypothetical protein